MDKEKHIFRNEASLVEIRGDRSGLAGLWLPEAQLRCWLAQFLCNAFLQFIVRYVQRDRQSHSVRVVDFHHHRGRLCSLSFTIILRTRSRDTLKDKCSFYLKILIWSSQCEYFFTWLLCSIVLVLVSPRLPSHFLLVLVFVLMKL